MVKKYFYPSISQSLLLLLLCCGLQVVTGIIAGIFLISANASLSTIYIAVLILSPICTMLTVFYGVYRSKIPAYKYLANNVKDKKIVIYSILFFIGIYFASSFIAGLLENIIPSDETVNAALTHGFNSPFGIFALVVLAPVFEESLFRGVMLRGFLKNYSIAKSLIITSLLFGLLHFNSVQSITAAILGLALGWVFIKTGSLWVCILLHALNNGISTVLYQLSINYNITDAQLSYAAIFFILIGIAAFIVLRRMPDNISNIYDEKEKTLSIIREQEISGSSMPEFSYNKPLKHSGPGIASFVISLTIWVADIFFLSSIFVTAFIQRGIGRNTLLLISSIFVLNLFASTVGLILGIAGVINKQRKKIFSVLGIIFNAFIILSLSFILFIRLYMNRIIPGGGINL